jgi:regulator of protease activity HflC (stomatin/prohibitin superfamily)
LLASCVTVPPGRAALVTGFAGLGPPLGEGVHFVGPWTSSQIIDLRQQEHDDDLRAITADGAAIEAGTSLVTWRPAPEELRELAREVGPDVYAVAVGPVVSSCARKVLGRLRLDELDTSHLRAAQAEVTSLAAAELRPLHVLLEGVELRQVIPLSPGVKRGFEAAAALEERVKGIPDQLRLTADRAAQLSARAGGIAAANNAVAPTLDPAMLAESRARALQQLLESKNASVVQGGASVLEVSP